MTYNWKITQISSYWKRETEEWLLTEQIDNNNVTVILDHKFTNFSLSFLQLGIDGKKLDCLNNATFNLMCDFIAKSNATKKLNAINIDFWSTAQFLFITATEYEIKCTKNGLVPDPDISAILDEMWKEITGLNKSNAMKINLTNSLITEIALTGDAQVFIKGGPVKISLSKSMDSYFELEAQSVWGVVNEPFIYCQAVSINATSIEILYLNKSVTPTGNPNRT